MTYSKRPGSVPPLHRPKMPATTADGVSLNWSNGGSLPLELGEQQLTLLEARWARFFDLLQVRWESGWPLPFWLPFTFQSEYARGFPPERGLWVGVSEFAPNDEMCQRYRDVALQSGHWTHLLVGQPQPGFQVWSWRLGDGRNIDGRYGVADVELTWENQDNFSCFDIDFTFNTIPSGIAVQKAFRAMREEAAMAL
jgi:hypothetical protein